MNTVKTNNTNGLIIKFDYDPKIVDIIKTFPQRKYEPYTKEWVVPITHLNFIKEKLKDFNFTFPESVNVPQDEEVKEVERCYWVEDGEVMIEFPYDPQILNIVKGFNGRRYLPGLKRWAFPLHYLEDLEPQLIELGFKSKIKQRTKMLAPNISIDEIKANYEKEIKPNLKLQLKSYQEQTLFEALQLDAYGLFLQQRIGKTPVALAYILYRRKFNNAGKTLLLCENSLLFNLANEIEKWTNLSYIIVKGSKPQRIKRLNEHKDVYLINYDALRILKDELKIIKFDISIADESQNFKNPKSQKTKIGIELSKNIKYKLILTGTPITRAPENIFMQMKFLNPNYLQFKHYFDFLSCFCTFDNYGGISGYKNLDDLQKRIEKYSKRLLRTDVRNDLPEKIYEKRVIEMTKEMIRQYSEMQETLSLEINEMERVTAAILLTKMLRLAQITSGHFLNESNPKLNELEEILEESNGDKVVIWCKYRESINLISRRLQEKGIKYYQIHGDVDTEERFNRMTKFNQDDSKAIIIQIQTGKVGLDLSSASIVVFFENDWDYGLRSQAEDRTQTVHKEKIDNVIHIDLIVSNDRFGETIDERILDIIQKKKSFSDYLIDDIKSLLK